MTIPYYSELSEAVQANAIKHVRDIVHIAIEHHDDRAALIVFDTDCPLAVVLSESYKRALPKASSIDVATVTNEVVMEAFAQLAAGSLVVLVQSTHFRLDAYRLRVQLFNQGLKVIEHVHLARMIDAQAELYIDALAYDPNYYRVVGKMLKNHIDSASGARICAGNDILFFDSPLEPAKMNIGDYRDMRNVGGQFPIGEVFTESLDLEAVHGRANVFLFGDTTFHCNQPETPMTLIVEKGRVVNVENSTPHFDDVLNKIREVEGEVWIRELGFGMNRAFSPTKIVDDIGTFERMCGIHLSLGAKHGGYNKPQFKRKDTRFHIDVFLNTSAVYIDDRNIFIDGQWKV